MCVTTTHGGARQGNCHRAIARMQLQCRPITFQPMHMTCFRNILRSSLRRRVKIKKAKNKTGKKEENQNLRQKQPQDGEQQCWCWYQDRHIISARLRSCIFEVKSATRETKNLAFHLRCCLGLCLQRPRAMQTKTNRWFQGSRQRLEDQQQLYIAVSCCQPA